MWGMDRQIHQKPHTQDKCDTKMFIWPVHILERVLERESNHHRMEELYIAFLLPTDHWDIPLKNCKLKTPFTLLICPPPWHCQPPPALKPANFSSQEVGSMTQKQIQQGTNNKIQELERCRRGGEVMCYLDRVLKPYPPQV